MMCIVFYNMFFIWKFKLWAIWSPLKR